MSEVKVNKISPRTNCGTVTVGDSGDSVSVTAGVPVTVNGDLKSNALKATDGGSIISQCGTTITLGASGDSITLASGATQTGFGRTGTVDWQTTPKTATFTAVNGEGYFINQSSAITANLPAGSAGAIVSFSDYARNFATYNLTISPNGSEKIGGQANDAILNINGQAATFVYVDSTKGWINVQNAEDTETGLVPAFVTATGGTVTCCGDYKIHTFTGPGTFCVSSAGNIAGSNTVSYMVVAGGGGGGGSSQTPNDAGTSGGGAGGYREGKASTDCYTASPLNAPAGLPVTASPYPITVGGGGAGTSSSAAGSKGVNSIFSTITSAGGGGGGGYQVPEGQACKPIAVLQGGSGGGGGTYQNSPGQSGSGTGNQPPVSPPQGNDGGNGTGGRGGAGGGGAGAVGTNGSPSNAGAGGNGVASEITGSPVTRGGGGGGASLPGSAAPGGTGGGGDGSNTPNGSTAGTANTGGGGAGGGKTCANDNAIGKAGGSGIVVIRYKFQ
jgi:hypothetical protein